MTSQFLESLSAALILTIFASLASAQPVWLDLDQEALDKAYDQAAYAPNLEQVLGRFDSNSELLRKRLGPPQRFAYGEGPDEGLDLFPADQANAPIHVFIHGGAWKFGSAAQNHYLAETFTSAGIHFIAPDFSPVQDLDGQLVPMVEQLRRALLWIHQNAHEKFGGDPNRIYLSGFSSGGQLAASLVTTDWTSVPGAPNDLIKGVLICSGMYDLTPVSLSYRSEYVNFTPETIEQLSAIRHLHRINCPVIVAYGSLETPEFQRQAVEFYDALQAHQIPSTLVKAEGYNHFEIIETMANPLGILGRVSIGQLHGIQ